MQLVPHPTHGIHPLVEEVQDQEVGGYDEGDEVERREGRAAVAQRAAPGGPPHGVVHDAVPVLASSHAEEREERPGERVEVGVRVEVRAVPYPVEEANAHDTVYEVEEEQDRPDIAQGGQGGADGLHEELQLAGVLQEAEEPRDAEYAQEAQRRAARAEHELEHRAAHNEAVEAVPAVHEVRVRPEARQARRSLRREDDRERLEADVQAGGVLVALAVVLR
mmetsp:Transcript_19839/g.67609  ORF Transcript_19839/g.67609 Transcript_19839/m.67609 type:complete len:221 (-) Transcript_19839:913-1575(-)